MLTVYLQSNRFPTAYHHPFSDSLVLVRLTFYPTERILLIVYNTRDLEKNKRSVISPDIQIKLLALFDPSIYDQLLEEGLLSQSMLDREETLKYMRDWKGFGDLNEKYPPAILH